MVEGLRKPTEVIVSVLTLLASGCPVQAMVQAYGLDERTVARWRDRAGKHGQQVHQAIVEQGSLDLGPVQADEIRVKGRKMIAWMGLAMMVSTRLWLGGVVSLTREKKLANRLLAQVRRWCLMLRPVVVITDGWAAYPGRSRRAFREQVKHSVGPGRCALVAWPEVLIATVIKHPQKRRVVEITRRMTQGALHRAEERLNSSQGGTVLKTAWSERRNATVRQRLATVTRTCRHAAQRLETLETGRDLIGGISNLCRVHDEWRSSTQVGSPCTPAMAAGLTDRVWTVADLLTFRIRPEPWVQPKRRGRPPKEPAAPLQRFAGRPAHLRPLLRLRKGTFHAFTS